MDDWVVDNLDVKVLKFGNVGDCFIYLYGSYVNLVGVGLNEMFMLQLNQFFVCVFC